MRFSKDKQALEKAGQEVMHLNRNLESLVAQRTEDLSRSEKKYRRVFEGSMDMIFILDDQGRFIDINKAGLTALGYGKRDELIGKTRLADLFASSDDYRQLVRDLHSDGYVKDRQCHLQAADGSDFFILVSATVRKDDTGEGGQLRRNG